MLGGNNDKLPHHAFVFMIQDMAVEHIRHHRISEIRKLHDNSRCFAWSDYNRILQPKLICGQCSAAPIHNLKLNIVDMKYMSGPRSVDKVPYFRITQAYLECTTHII